MEIVWSSCLITKPDTVWRAKGAWVRVFWPLDSQGQAQEFISLMCAVGRLGKERPSLTLLSVCLPPDPCPSSWQLNMSDSHEECHVQLLLAQQEHLESIRVKPESDEPEESK